MARYTQLDSIEINKLAGFFGVNNVASFSSLEGGAANSSFLLRTPNAFYILSVCDEKKFEEIKKLSSLLDHLENHNFPTTKIVRSSCGNTVASYRGNPVFLKKFIEGEVCADLNPRMLKQLGESIADLHDIPAPNYLPDVFPYGVDFFSEITSSNSDFQFNNWLKKRKVEITSKFSSDLPRGLIHGDLFYDNILFKEGSLAAILDFEEASNYYLIFDLGMCAVGTCTDKGRISLPKLKVLVDGYQTKRELSNLEKVSLQTFVEYGAVATSFWRFRQHNIIKPNKDNSKRFIEMFNFANEVISVSPADFIYALF